MKSVYGWPTCYVGSVLLGAGAWLYESNPGLGFVYAGICFFVIGILQIVGKND